jgi:hypothetical protein
MRLAKAASSRGIQSGTPTLLKGQTIMKRRQGMTKQNSSTKDLNGAARSRIGLRRRTRSKNPGAAQVRSEPKAAKIKRDLNERKVKNQKRKELERSLERFVLDLDLDWVAFHYMLFEAFEEVGCNHKHALCRRILAIMGLDKAIEKCLSYFTLQGGGCDCEVALNVDMTAPKPLVDISCADCAYDYDEYYMVRDDIWKARGAGTGMLCIGCLEKRVGRLLRRQDFTDVPLNQTNSETQSLRLQDRLGTLPYGKGSNAGPSPQATASRRRHRRRSEASNQQRQTARKTDASARYGAVNR